MDIVKISMIGVCGVMLGFILKGTRPEYASFISMAVGLLILGLAVGKVSYLFETLERLRQSLYFSNMASASGSNFTRASILFFFLWYFSQRLPSSSRKRFSSVMDVYCSFVFLCTKMPPSQIPQDFHPRFLLEKIYLIFL